MSLVFLLEPFRTDDAADRFESCISVKDFGLYDADCTGVFGSLESGDLSILGEIR